jgi:hypothetical protein
MQDFQGISRVLRLAVEGLVSFGIRRTSRRLSRGSEYHGKVGIGFSEQFVRTGFQPVAHRRSNPSHSKLSAVKHSQSRRRLFIFSLPPQLRQSAQPFLTPVGLVSPGTRRTALPHRGRVVGVPLQQLQAASFRAAEPAFATHRTAPPNPSLKRTHNSVRRMAFISFWAMRRTLLCAA